MKGWKYRLQCFLIVLLLGSVRADGCTGIKAQTPQGVVVGCNEDYNRTYRDVVARIYPATGIAYGYAALGFQRHDIFMMALNDQGLFLDLFSAPTFFPWQYDPDKVDYDGPVEEKIMKTCGTVEEAVTCLQTTNNPAMGTYAYQVFVVDATGASAVINWGDGNIEVTRSQESYQVVTNFFLQHPECGSYPCWRYVTASEMMRNAEEISFDLIRQTLETVNLSSNFSLICNPGTGDMAIFNTYNFDEIIGINLHDILQMGSDEYLIPDYCSQIKLLSPVEGAVISPSTDVVLEWQGLTTSQYQVAVSADPAFTDCDPIDVTPVSAAVQATAYPGLLFYGIFCLAFSTGFCRKWTIVQWILLLIGFFVFLSCPSPDMTISSQRNPLINTYQVTLEELQSGTTYYWKVIGNGDDSIHGESIVRSFYRGE